MKDIKNIYIIGIGGISLSALAVILRNRGFYVKGSDLVDGERVEALIKKGFEIKVGHCDKFVDWADVLIVSSAIPNDDKDVLRAKQLGKKIISRAEVLGELSKMFRTISIAGCHGKTTATGMISSVMLRLKEKPCIHIGGIMNDLKDNVFEGNSDIFITEACEYKDSFLHLSSELCVILNIKPDHLDYFQNFENVKKSFFAFAKNVRGGGKLIVNGDDQSCREIIQNQDIHVDYITFGLNENNDIRATDIKEFSAGKYSFVCKIKGKDVKFDLPLYGFHNIYNALATIAVCSSEGIDSKIIKTGIEQFGGISRRFEKVFEDDNKIIIHDYAHHPDEIEASIRAGEKIGKKKLIVVFQPHTFTRTRDFFDGFCDSLSCADEIWLLPIYPAREKPLRGVSSRKIYERLLEMGKNSKYFSDFTSIYNKIKKINDDCLVLILGAGDVENLARMFGKNIDF